MTDKIKEYPILFAAPMVKAILDDKKHMTRRPVKGKALEWLRPGMFSPAFVANPENGMCPYGVEGERLWVREAWKANRDFDDCPPRDLPEGSSLWWLADDSSNRGMGAKPGRYRHARFMPRWASRINLENTCVRIERVQDISEQDILAEGITVDLVAEWCNVPRSDMPTLHDAWRVAWAHVNGSDSWERNDSVWVISFRRIQEGGK